MFEKLPNRLARPFRIEREDQITQEITANGELFAAPNEIVELASELGDAPVGELEICRLKRSRRRFNDAFFQSIIEFLKELTLTALQGLEFRKEFSLRYDRFRDARGFCGEYRSRGAKERASHR